MYTTNITMNSISSITSRIALPANLSTVVVPPNLLYKFQSGDKVNNTIYDWSSGTASATNAADSATTATISTTIYKIGNSSLYTNAGDVGNFYLPLNTVVGSSMTFAFWLYNMDTVNNTWLFRIEFNGGSGNLYWRTSGTEYLTNFGRGYYGRTVFGTNPSTLNVWRHYATVYDNANSLIYEYVDGTLYSEGPYSNPAGSILQNTLRGMTYGTINCAIDDVRLYKTTALSARQVRALYQGSE